MRVNVYADEVTDRIALETRDLGREGAFVGIRMYLELPSTQPINERATVSGEEKPRQIGITEHRGPYKPGTVDRSSAVTIWARSRRELREVIQSMMRVVDEP